MKHTISVLVENRSGVLSRIAGLFSRRAFNIDSLAVGVTDDPEVSRITIVVDVEQDMVEQVEKQLNKLIDVIKIKRLAPDELLARELLLVKVSAGADKRSEITTIAEIMNAKIIDITLTTMTLEASSSPSDLARLEEILKPYGIIEIVRTGTIAIQKGAEGISVNK